MVKLFRKYLFEKLFRKYLLQKLYRKYLFKKLFRKYLLEKLIGNVDPKAGGLSYKMLYTNKLVALF